MSSGGEKGFRAAMAESFSNTLKRWKPRGGEKAGDAIADRKSTRDKRKEHVEERSGILSSDQQQQGAAESETNHELVATKIQALEGGGIAEDRRDLFVRH